MGKKGGSAHLKREMAPRFWPIHRKEFSWVAKPRPGPHPISQCIPLIVIVREMLGFAKTAREAKMIISQGKILVDGEVRRDERFPAGLMDVISIPEIGKDYRLIPSGKGLILNPISPDEAKFKLCRVENKRTIVGGETQLNLHDGRNLLIRDKELSKDAYHVLDTLKISLPEQELLEHLKLGKGIQALLVGGANIGKHGAIANIAVQPGRKRGDSIVAIKGKAREVFQTTLNHVFVIGDKTPRISLQPVEDQ